MEVLALLLALLHSCSELWLQAGQRWKDILMSDSRTWSKRQMTKTRKKSSDRLQENIKDRHKDNVVTAERYNAMYCTVQSPKVKIKGARQTISDKPWDWINRSCQGRCLMEEKEEPLKHSMGADALLIPKERKTFVTERNWLIFMYFFPAYSKNGYVLYYSNLTQLKGVST